MPFLRQRFCAIIISGAIECLVSPAEIKPKTSSKCNTSCRECHVGDISLPVSWSLGRWVEV
jgi:hypothetical protein